MNEPRHDPEATGGHRTSRALLGVAALCLALLFAVAGFQSWRDLATVRGRKDVLQERIDATETRIENLERRIRGLRTDRMETDPGPLEQQAREQLGLVYPGDTVIILPEE